MTKEDNDQDVESDPMINDNLHSSNHNSCDDHHCHHEIIITRMMVKQLKKRRRIALILIQQCMLWSWSLAMKRLVPLRFDLFDFNWREMNWQRSCQGWWGDQKSLPTDCWLRRWDWPTERFPINRYFVISNMKGFVATHMQVLTPSMVSRASGTRLTKSSRTFWTKARMTAMKIARRNSTRLSREICEG